jgi:hypothetical protein
MDDRYSFDKDAPFSDFAAWYEWQTEALRKEIDMNKSYRLTSKVTLRRPSKDGRRLLRTAGEGVCTLTAEGLTYEGTEDGNAVTLEFQMKHIYRLLFGAGEDFEIYVGNEIYYFVPEERRSAVEWYVASIILSDRLNLTS